MQAQSSSEINELAGEFKAEYKLVGDLTLVGITWEHFASKSGYEGDTIYFLEENTKCWYTYTNARPTFYEGKKRSAYAEKAQAPWGLGVSLEEMAGLKIQLQGAKCDGKGRLSSSQETKAEVTGRRELKEELLQGWYHEDFAEAFSAHVEIEDEQNTEEQQREQLVFLKPAQTEAAEFEEVAQVLRMPLWDAKGRRILVEVPYSKKEEQTIRYLERMKETPPPCFLGRLYLKESQLQLYPLDLFTRRELPWCEGEKKLFGMIPRKIDHKEQDSDSPQQAVQEVLKQVESVLEDLYQTGFDTVQESILQRCRELVELAELYGMEYLRNTLAHLTEQLVMNRHRMKQTEDADKSIQQYLRLWEYSSVGQKKVMYDMAADYYKNEEE